MALTAGAGAEAVSAADGTTAASRSVSAQKRCHSGVAETSLSPTGAVGTSGCDSGASLEAGDRHTHGDDDAAADAVQHKKMKTQLHLASATTATATATATADTATATTADTATATAAAAATTTTTAAGDSTTTTTVTDEAMVASTMPKPETPAAAGPAAVSVHQSLTSLAGWRVQRVLRNDASRKMVAVLASVAKRPAEQTGNNSNGSGSNNNNGSSGGSNNNTGDNNGSGSGSDNNISSCSSWSCEEPAVVVLEKQPFDSSTVAQLFDGATSVTQLFCNDIYGGYSATVAPALNPVKMTIIQPATAKHIDKHSDNRMLMVDETPQLYRTALLPCIAEHRFTHEWVYNILEHRNESDRIVYEDCDPLTGFVLLPDLKWDPAGGGGTDSLYLVALVRRRDLTSLRDLDHTHLPLLRNIHTAGIDAVVKRYGVHRSDIRAYFHYRPSYYHLHVHITAASFDAPGRHVGRAHLLSTVINNIELMSDYYGRCTMSYFVSQSEHLANHLRQAGYDLAAVKQHSTIDNKATDNTAI